MKKRLLVSLLGRPRPGGSYEHTPYRFQQGGDAFTKEAAFFGGALFRYLREKEQGEPDLLLLGTTGSAWDYVEDFFVNGPYPIPDGWDAISSVLKEEVERKAVSQGTVDKAMELLGEALSARVKGLVLEDPPTPEATYSRFMDAVQSLYRDVPAAEIHLDITHGYRYLPFVLLGGALLLRHVWGSRIFLHYGGLELPRLEGGAAQVVDLSLLHDLVELDESLSVLGTTGDFRAYFGPEKAQPTFLALEANQQQNVSSALRRLKEEHPPLVHPLVRDWVDGILEKLSGDKFEDKLANRARFFWERGQYFKAVLLLYEAILVAGVKRFLPGKDPLNYEVRVQARDELVGHIRSLGGEWEETYDLLRRVRNAIAHGTRPERGDAQSAAKDYKELEGVFKKGVALFEKLKEASP